MEFTQEERDVLIASLECYKDEGASRYEIPVIEKLLTTIKGKNTDPEFKEP